MLSPEQRARHDGIRAWLMGEDEQAEQLHHVWMAARVGTIVAIWNRVSDAKDIAELIVMLAFGHTVLLWAPPDWSTGSPRDLVVPPLPKGAEGDGSFTARKFTATPSQRTRPDTRVIQVRFETHRRVHLAGPINVEIVVREGDRLARVTTSAVSPPDANASRPRFRLQGLDLVGAIDIEDQTGDGDWSWSYRAIPSHGDLQRTLDVLSATLRGGLVEVTCPDDSAVILSPKSFSATDTAQEYQVRKLARMAHYVAVVNRALAMDLELTSFSDSDFATARRIALEDPMSRAGARASICALGREGQPGA